MIKHLCIVLQCLHARGMVSYVSYVTAACIKIVVTNPEIIHSRVTVHEPHIILNFPNLVTVGLKTNLHTNLSARCGDWLKNRNQ